MSNSSLKTGYWFRTLLECGTTAPLGTNTRRGTEVYWENQRWRGPSVKRILRKKHAAFSLFKASTPSDSLIWLMRKVLLSHILRGCLGGVFVVVVVLTTILPQNLSKEKLSSQDLALHTLAGCRELISLFYKEFMDLTKAVLSINFLYMQTQSSLSIWSCSTGCHLWSYCISFPKDKTHDSIIRKQFFILLSG